MKSKILFKMEQYIGKKIKGFKFEDNAHFRYVAKMNNYIGKVGIIQSYVCEKNSFLVEFSDNSTWCYPIDEAFNHLVKEFIPTNCDGTPVEVKPSVTIVSKIPSVESLLRGAKPIKSMTPTTDLDLLKIELRAKLIIAEVDKDKILAEEIIKTTKDFEKSSN